MMLLTEDECYSECHCSSSLLSTFTTSHINKAEVWSAEETCQHLLMTFEIRKIRSTKVSYDYC